MKLPALATRRQSSSAPGAREDVGALEDCSVSHLGLGHRELQAAHSGTEDGGLCVSDRVASPVQLTGRVVPMSSGCTTWGGR